MTVTESFLQVGKQFGIAVAVSLLSLVGLSIASWRLLSRRDSVIATKDSDIQSLNDAHATKIKDISTAHATQLVDALAAKDMALAERDAVIISKDIEIKRLNDVRLSEVQGHGSQMVTVARESTQLVAATNQSLSTTADAMKEWSHEVKDLRDEVKNLIAKG